MYSFESHKYYDVETNLYYLNSRYYNPEVGRFINADGLLGENGNIKSSNMFMYANNNPIMFVDTTGEWALLAILAATNPIALVVVAVVLVVLVVVAVESGVADAVIDTIDDVSNTIENQIEAVKTQVKAKAAIAAIEIATTMKENSNTRYWSASLDFSKGGPNIGRSLKYSDAVIEVSEGRNVICRYSFEAWSVASAAGGHASPLWHEAHRSKVNFYDHYHINGHGEGHVWYIYF